MAVSSVIVLCLSLACASASLGAATQPGGSSGLFDLSLAPAPLASEFRALLAKCDADAPGFAALVEHELRRYAPVSTVLASGSLFMFGAPRAIGTLVPQLELDLADLRQLPATYRAIGYRWVSTRCRVVGHELAEYSHYRSRHSPRESSEPYRQFVQRLEMERAHAHAAGTAAENKLRALAGVTDLRSGRCNDSVGVIERVNLEIGRHTEVQLWKNANLASPPTYKPSERLCAQLGKPLLP